MSKLKMLQDAAHAEAKAARDIAEKADAERRNLTADERARFDAHMEKGRGLIPQIQQAKADEEVIAGAKALAAGIGAPIGSSPRETGRKGWAQATVKSLRYHRRSQPHRGWHRHDRGRTSHHP
jgi:hypothetical protein